MHPAYRGRRRGCRCQLLPECGAASPRPWCPCLCDLYNSIPNPKQGLVVAARRLSLGLLSLNTMQTPDTEACGVAKQGAQRGAQGWRRRRGSGGEAGGQRPRQPLPRRRGGRPKAAEEESMLRSPRSVAAKARSVLRSSADRRASGFFQLTGFLFTNAGRGLCSHPRLSPRSVDACACVACARHPAGLPASLLLALPSHVGCCAPPCGPV